MNLSDISTVTSDIESGNAVDSAVLSILMLLGVFILIRRRSNWSEIVKRNKWLLILFVYMGLSVVWSNFGDVTIRRWFRSLGTIIMVLIVLTEADPLEGISALLRRCFYLHLPLSIIAIKYFRNIGVDYGRWGVEEMWIGLTMHKNNLGQVSMISGLYFSWSIMNKWRKKTIWVDLLYLLMSIWLLLGSDDTTSKTGIVGFLIGLCVLLGLQYFKKNIAYLKQHAMVMFLLLGASAVFMQVVIELATNKSTISYFIESTGRDVTLTDRTLLWNDVLQNASAHAVLGVGYGAFWVGEMGHDVYPLPEWTKKTPGWRPNEGHNGYIDAYVELGLVGVSLILIIIMTTMRRIINLFTTNFEYAQLFAVLLAVLLLNNITESSLLKGTHSLWFLFLLVVLGVPRLYGPRPSSKTW